MPAALQQTTVRLPKQLLRKAKAFAAKKRVSLTKLIEDGLRAQIDATSADTAEPFVLPVCSQSLIATGFRPQLPPDAATWSVGKWEEWADQHP